MGLIGPINWKNAAENLTVGIVFALLGAFITYKVMRLTTDDVLTQLKPTIEKAIDKETIKNEIKNEIEIKDNKIKKSDTINININQKPKNHQKPQNSIVKQKDCVIDVNTYNKLTTSQKNRLNRWIK